MQFANIFRATRHLNEYSDQEQAARPPHLLELQLFVIHEKEKYEYLLVFMWNVLLLLINVFSYSFF